MKKILTFVIAIVAMACSKSKEDHSALYGEWAFQSEVENGQERKGLCDEYTYAIITENILEVHRFIEGNGGCAEKVTKINYTVSGNQISTESEGQKFSISYTIKGDILTLTSPSGVVTTYKKNTRKTPPATPVNPFIGTWKLQEYIANDVDKTTDCERKSTIVFTENAITLNGFYAHHSSNSCVQDEAIDFTYTYTDGKVKNLKEKKTGEIADTYITLTLENGFLVYTYVEEEVKIVRKYKK